MGTAGDGATRAKLPLDLKIAGLLLVFSGTEAAIDVVASLFFQTLSLNVAVLAFFAGVGVLRFRERWRALAVTLYWIVFALAAVALAIALLAFSFGARDRILDFSTGLAIHNQYIGELPLWLVYVTSAIGTVLFVWVFLVLRRAGVLRLFKDAPTEGQTLSGGLRVCVVLAVLLAFARIGGALYIRQAYPASNMGVSWGRAGRMNHIGWGHRWGRLSYIVLQSIGAEDPEAEIWLEPIVRSYPEGKAWLRKPDGSRALLPGDHFIYAWIDSEWSTNDFRMTGPELEAFKESPDRECSMDALVSFVRGLRAGDRPAIPKRPATD